MASRNPIRTRCSSHRSPSTRSAATTWYSFGSSRSHKVISSSPVSVTVTVVWPGPLITTGTCPAAITSSSSRSETATSAFPSNAAAASTVTCTSTCRVAASSTLTGLANTSARNACGTTRSRTSR